MIAGMNAGMTAGRVRRFLRLVRRQTYVQLRIRTFQWFSLGLFFFQPALFSGIGMLLARSAGHLSPDLVYNVIGGGIMGMWSGLVFTSTYDISRDRWGGTLELIVGSPTSLWKVEAIRTFSNVVAGLVSLVAAVLAASLVYRFPLARADLPAALFSLLTILFGLWCMGVFLANFLVWSRTTGTLVNFLEIPMAVFCGFMYPVSILPSWMQAISMAFPIRWGLEAMDAALSGPVEPLFLWGRWGLAIGVGCVYWAMAVWLGRKVHDLIRITGELSSV